MRRSGRTIAALLCLLGLLAAWPALAAEPATAPFLRLDTKMHTAVINDLAVDGKGTLVATASDDKTVRLWHAADGTLAGTLRVPIGDGPEGSLYAVALDPAGKRLLTGGATCITWDGKFCAYLFDVEGRRLLTRLPGLPEAVMRLAYAPDGASFALGLGRKGGVRVYDATRGRELWADREYGDRVSALVFDPSGSGRVAAASYDGKVRVYDGTGKRTASAPAPGGKRPSALAFSPDGKLLAVAYDDGARVDVLAPDTLKTRLTPKTNGLGGGALNAVAWGLDAGGAPVLAAAGRARLKGDERVVLRSWAKGGAGGATDTALGRDTVTRLLALPDGRIAFATADPAWGAADAGGRIAYRRAGGISDFRSMSERLFTVSENGTVVTFRPNAPESPTLRFDLEARSLATVTASEPGAPAAKGKAAAAKVTGLNGPKPRIGKEGLVLDSGELARSAVTLAGGDILLGTDYFLRRYDGRGRESAVPLAAPAAVWALTATADGRTVVAGLGDGTLRWYRLDPEGGPPVEVAALFARADRPERWVMWTPEGFFDHADVGGAELVGYLLNDGKAKTPEWVGFAQLYRLFHAPELLRARIGGADEGGIEDRVESIRNVRDYLRAAALPGVEWLQYCVTPPAGGSEECRDLPKAASATVPAPAEAGAQPAAATPAHVHAILPDGVTDVRLTYRLVDRGSGLSDVDLFLNDRNVGRQPAPAPGATRGVGDAAGTDKPGPVDDARSVPLDPGPNRLQVRAYNGKGEAYAVSPPITLMRSSAPAPQEADGRGAAEETAGRLFVLAIAVNDYADPAPKALKLAVPDAQAVVERLRADAASLFSEIQITTLYDKAADPGAIDAALETVAVEATEEDTFLLYLAGHGEEVRGDYYFLTPNVDLRPAAGDREQERAIIVKDAFSGQRLIRQLSEVPAKNSLIFLDTCHAAAVKLDAGASRINEESGRYILVASQKVETALDSYDGKNGVFGYAVLEGLRGKARRGNEPRISNLDLGFFVRDRVKELAREKGHAQSSSFKIMAEDFRPFPLVTAAP